MAAIGRPLQRCHAIVFFAAAPLLPFSSSLTTDV
jgi:hypothetical protein